MPPIPADKQQILDLYFLEHRAKILDIAAFLDRYDRAGGAGDFRIDAFREALAVLHEDKPGRAKRVLEALSDHSTDPIPVAPGKGAVGAQPPADSSGGAC